jgi:hypothetical protein
MATLVLRNRQCNEAKGGKVRPKELTPANEKDIVLDETAKPITSAQEIF